LDHLKKRSEKVGTLPDKVINLGYFDIEEISPSNSLTVLDTSAVIKENFIEQKNDQYSLLANEVGMLFDLDGGGSRFSSNNFDITNYSNSYLNLTDYVDVQAVNGRLIREGVCC
jgi:mRNA deadenylase 3'-5' endonuclease subunit Ccr4